MIRVLRRLLLFVAAVAAFAIVGLLAGGRLMLETGLLRVEGSTFLKPIQVLVLSLALAVALSPGVRTAARHSRVIGFYLLAAIVMWTLALGPVTTFMGSPGMTGPFRLLMSLPGVGSLRVPARSWMMTVLCLSVVAGVVVATGTRGRSRGVALVTVLLAASGVLSDGWVDRIRAAPLPDPVPGAALLTGATVLDVPPDIVSRDIASVFRAVNGGWKTVNGYSGWWPSYYDALVAAGRAEAEDLVIPFQQLGELHVVVGQDAAGLRSLIERQPGVSIVASDRSLVHYRLPPRSWANTSRLEGRRLGVRELGSACSTESLPRAIDGDESSLWQCARWDGHQALTVDLGEVGTVGGIVHSLGSESRSFPLALSVETSEDGVGWSPAWSGNVLAKAIAAAMEDPRRLRIPIAFSPRQARFLRLRATPYDVDVPWTIAELEVWSK